LPRLIKTSADAVAKELIRGLGEEMKYLVFEEKFRSLSHVLHATLSEFLEK
jgi:hypothetical protein